MTVLQIVAKAPAFIRRHWWLGWVLFMGLAIWVWTHQAPGSREEATTTTDTTSTTDREHTTRADATVEGGRTTVNPDGSITTEGGVVRLSVSSTGRESVRVVEKIVREEVKVVVKERRQFLVGAGAAVDSRTGDLGIQAIVGARVLGPIGAYCSVAGRRRFEDPALSVGLMVTF